MDSIPRLVLRAQCGDKDARAKLVAFIAPEISRYVARIANHDSLAEDIAQDSLLQICRKLRHIRNPEVFRFWALRIASRTAFRALRKRRIDISLDDAPQGATRDHQAESDIMQGVAKEAVERLLVTLTPASRAVLALHYLDGYTLAEVADILEIPLGTVKSRLAYGIAALRQYPIER